MGFSLEALGKSLMRKANATIGAVIRYNTITGRHADALRETYIWIASDHLPNARYGSSISLVFGTQLDNASPLPPPSGENTTNP